MLLLLLSVAVAGETCEVFFFFFYRPQNILPSFGSFGPRNDAPPPTPTALVLPACCMPHLSRVCALQKMHNRPLRARASCHAVVPCRVCGVRDRKNSVCAACCCLTRLRVTKHVVFWRRSVSGSATSLSPATPRNLNPRMPIASSQGTALSSTSWCELARLVLLRLLAQIRSWFTANLKRNA